MKTFTVREVPHNLRQVLKWVERGEKVVVTRRRRAIATLGPVADTARPRRWLDFMARQRAIWGTQPSGKPLSRAIIDERAERI